MKEEIIDFWNSILKRKLYYVPLLFLSIMGYGFSLFNRTDCMDNILFPRYYDYPGVHLRAGRWGGVFLRKVIYCYEDGPFALDFIGLCALLLCAGLTCFLLYIVNGKNKSIMQYTVFSSLFITYPLIGEVWIYKIISLYIPLCFVIITLIYLKTIKKCSLKTMGISIILFFPAAMGYEVTYFVYITLTLMMIYLDYGIYENRKGWFKEGIICAIPLVIDYILYVVIGKVLLLVLQLQPASNGERQINWIRYPLALTFKEIAYNFYYYVIRAFEYIPIGIFCGGVVIFIIITTIVAVKQRQVKVIGLGILVLISLFLLAIVRGSYMNYRTAWTIVFFVPFVGYLCVNLYDKVIGINQDKTKVGMVFKRIMVVSLLYLAFEQAVYLHYLLEVENQRSDNEMSIARQLGYHILSEYDDKKVVFVGELDLGDWYEAHIIADEDSFGGSIEHYFRQIFTPGVPNYKYTDSLGSLSVLNALKWNGNTGKQLYLQKYFSYLGYDISVDEDLTYEELLEYEEFADKENMKPFEMKEVNDILLINLG